MDLSNPISLHPYPVMITQESDRENNGDPGTSTALESTRAPDESVMYRNTNTQELSDDELERQSGPQYSRENDPLRLSTKIKSPDEIDGIRKNISRRNSLVGTLNLDKKASMAKKIGHFYEEQNENISRLLKPVEDHRREAKEQNESNAWKYKIAINASFAGNICLAVLQLYGAASSGSLSLITTMADALFDPLSNLTLLLCHRAIKNVNPRKFPQGKARIETAGNITFCFLMCAVSIVIIVSAVRELAEGVKNHPQTNKLYVSSTAAVSVAIGVKTLLFLYCYPLRNKYSYVRILWEDHRNDIIINGAGLLTSILGAKVRWFIDPIGAVVLSLLILGLWLKTAFSEFQLLIGTSADTAILQHITYISMTHSPDIVALDTVRAWHSGPRLIVEVDIVMDADETLRDTHDVAEELQTKLESLPNVDRAYVHVDYETSHAPEHFTKKEL